jgi:S-formylglutathione hydrolase FrmB
MKASTMASLIALASLVAPAAAAGHDPVDRVNARLCGTLLDFTKNSGHDRRIYSAALCECRDLYVYLPPGYDPSRSYALLIWLHSYTMDEREFAIDVAPSIDQAIACGLLPPLIVAAPDGSLTGSPRYAPLGSWYVNSRRGRFADYIVQDVLGFMEQDFAVCPDRGARAIVGFSMGGFGAYSLALKNPDKFKLVAGIAPALNLRYISCTGDYFADFDPNCWCLRDNFDAHDVVGRFYGGLFKTRAWMVVGPVWGKGPCAVARASADNPIELLDRVAPGQQEYFAAYGRADELNIDAQVESFVHVASQRGIHVEARSYLCGNHSIPFMLAALPEFFAWLRTHLSCPNVQPAPQSQATLTQVPPQPNRPVAPRKTALLILPQPDLPVVPAAADNLPIPAR